jgi:hypothetical protein
MHLAHSVTWDHLAEHPLMLGTKHRKNASSKAKVPGLPYVCLLQIWTMFSLASNAAHKNQGTEWVVSCSDQTQLCRKSCVFTYETIQTSTVRDTEARNQKIWPCREIIARIRSGNVHAGCIFINKVTARLSSKVNGIMSWAGEHGRFVTHSRERHLLQLKMVCAISKTKFLL